MEDYLKTKGRIFDIQRYSIHDGNGIRTIVFLKGCVLHCRWCCNPESQSYEIETMMVQGEPKIIGEDTTVGEVMKTVEKDRTYYRRTGGGLTLSGGESLCQPEFARDMLRAAHEAGITTAMESMGCADYSVIEEILPYLDQYLLDIKHMNSKKHEEFTGRGNELMLENAKKIAASGMTELSIRIPVIPGFNDTPEEIRDIAVFTRELGHVKRLHLLPYHRLGQDKYDGLNRPYLMGGCFGVALSLVLMAGAELFTGSNFVMAVGMFQKKVTFQDSVTVWVTCWLGNLAGSVLVAGMYSLTGLCTGSVQAIMADTTAMKMSVEPLPLFMRAILCNILVCLAVWCGIKMKTETGKLIMTFWCLITFFTAGFEHSVANMSLMMIGLLNPAQYDISIGGYAYNLAVVTIGNMVGGILFLAVPYFLIGKEKVAKN